MSKSPQIAAARALRAKMAQGPVLGCWLELCSGPVAEIVGRSGFGFAIIDLEHGPASLTEAIVQMQALSGTDCAPLVRVPWNDPVWIKRALDAGAAGLVIPCVNSAEEARLAIEACLYPPQGVRGMAFSIVRASGYGHETQYVAEVNDSILIILQIETRAALSAVEEIAALPRCDVLFLGPSDLSGDMGFPGEQDHPDVVEAARLVVAAGKAHETPVATIVTPGRDAKRLVADGFSLVTNASDVSMLRKASNDAVNALD